jgi:hypothetical protein
VRVLSNSSNERGRFPSTDLIFKKSRSPRVIVAFRLNRAGFLY